MLQFSNAFLGCSFELGSRWGAARGALRSAAALESSRVFLLGKISHTSALFHVFFEKLLMRRLVVPQAVAPGCRGAWCAGQPDQAAAAGVETRTSDQGQCI